MDFMLLSYAQIVTNEMSILNVFFLSFLLLLCYILPYEKETAHQQQKLKREQRNNNSSSNSSGASTSL